VTDKPTTAKTDSGAEAVAAAIGRLGGVDAAATAAAIAAEAGVAYSTTNKKLRALTDAGRAESFDGPDNRTRWRLTDNALTAMAAAGQPDDDGQTVVTAPPDEQTARPHVTVTPADLADQLADEADTPAEPDGGEPTDAAADGATLTQLGDQLPGALDASAGQPTVALADPHADADGDPDPAGGDAGQVGPPDDLPAGEQPDPVGAEPSDAAIADAAQTADGVDPTAVPAVDAASRADTGDRTAQAPDQGPDQATDQPAAQQAGPATVRRSAGALPGAVLDILAAHPERQYTIGELCKLINEVSVGTGAAQASRGAVANAATKVVGQRRAEQTVERPATYQLARTPRNVRYPGGGCQGLDASRPPPMLLHRQSATPSVRHPAITCHRQRRCPGRWLALAGGLP